MILRAKPKTIAELPAWALCCDKIRKIYESQSPIEIEVHAEIFLAEVECRFCGRVYKDRQYREVVEQKRGAIPVECFEFDEGVQ